MLHSVHQTFLVKFSHPVASYLSYAKTNLKQMLFVVFIISLHGMRFITSFSLWPSHDTGQPEVVKRSG